MEGNKKKERHQIHEFALKMNIDIIHYYNIYYNIVHL
jgi:hypothetical protein